MYSPRIDERLIPVLYHLARARRTPMTALVAEAVQDYLARQDLSQLPRVPSVVAFVSTAATATPTGADYHSAPEDHAPARAA